MKTVREEKISEKELSILRQILSEDDFDYINEQDSLYMNYLRLSGEGIFDVDYIKFCNVINEF